MPYKVIRAIGPCIWQLFTSRMEQRVTQCVKWLSGGECDLNCSSRGTFTGLRVVWDAVAYNI